MGWNKGEDDEDDEEDEEDENSPWHVRFPHLSQLTCKTFETGTNANSSDMLALEILKAIQMSSLSQWWGARSRVNIRSGLWMAQCVRAKQGAVKAQDPPGCLPLYWAWAWLLPLHEVDHHHSPLTGTAAVSRPGTHCAAGPGSMHSQYTKFKMSTETAI